MAQLVKPKSDKEKKADLIEHLKSIITTIESKATVEWDITMSVEDPIEYAIAEYGTLHFEYRTQRITVDISIPN